MLSAFFFFFLNNIITTFFCHSNILEITFHAFLTILVVNVINTHVWTSLHVNMHLLQDRKEYHFLLFFMLYLLTIFIRQIYIHMWKPECCSSCCIHLSRWEVSSSCPAKDAPATQLYKWTSSSLWKWGWKIRQAQCLQHNSVVCQTGYGKYRH